HPANAEPGRRVRRHRPPAVAANRQKRFSDAHSHLPPSSSIWTLKRWLKWNGWRWLAIRQGEPLPAFNAGLAGQDQLAGGGATQLVEAVGMLDHQVTGVRQQLLAAHPVVLDVDLAPCCLCRRGHGCSCDLSLYNL